MRRTALSCMAVGCFLIPVVTLILVLRFVSQRGIRPPRRVPGGATLSIPPSGQARILARKIAEKPDRLEWQWTVVGDRNWTTARSNDEGFVLGGAYPFNSRSTLGGTHIWFVDLAVSRSPAASGQFRVDMTLHGSNGTTVSQTRTASATGDSPSVATVAAASQTGDALVSVGSSVRLADIAGKPINLQLQP